MTGMISSVGWGTYAIPFRKPFSTAYGTVAERTGLIIQIQNRDGLCGIGEAAPLPEFTTSQLEDVERLLNTVAVELVGQTISAAIEITRRLHSSGDSARVLRFGLETALFDLHGQAQGKSIAQLLWDSPRTQVPVNATVSSADTADAIEAACQAVAQGFTSIKLKVGMGENVTDEINRIHAIRDALAPDVRLRLDANAVWGRQTAHQVLGVLRSTAIEMIEQPLSPNDLAGMAELRRRTAIPIAADEAVVSVDAVTEILEASAADVLVIKPAIVGGLTTTRQIVDFASTRGVDVVVTSMLETDIGVAGAVHLAAGLPGPVALACGLATTQLLTTPVVSNPLSIDSGFMTVPIGPGIGVSLNHARLNLMQRGSWTMVNQ